MMLTREQITALPEEARVIAEELAAVCPPGWRAPGGIDTLLTLLSDAHTALATREAEVVTLRAGLEACERDFRFAGYPYGHRIAMIRTLLTDPAPAVCEIRRLAELGRLFKRRIDDGTLGRIAEWYGENAVRLTTDWDAYTELLTDAQAALDGAQTAPDVEIERKVRLAESVEAKLLAGHVLRRTLATNKYEHMRIPPGIDPVDFLKGEWRMELLGEGDTPQAALDAAKEE